MATASAKALASYQAALDDKQKGDPKVVIAADTIVVGADGQVLEKPRSEREHVEMLRMLRDGSRVRSVGPGEAMAVGQVEEAARMVEGMGLGGGMRGEGAVRTKKAAKGNGKAGGAWHKVYTAVAVCAPLESARDPGYALETTVEETGVRFAADGKMDFEMMWWE